MEQEDEVSLADLQKQRRRERSREYFQPGKNSLTHSHTLFCPRDYAYVTNDKKTCKENYMKFKE